ncbi:hypothetical protein AB2L28_00865 [Kineococcus sp. TBRC 1896]|uniref:Uncharacterized protein n=1 Tax=Kineococcus mangrovi TaxID=1660183 RepID=A0ABV4HWJ1_9ACTN
MNRRDLDKLARRLDVDVHLLEVHEPSGVVLVLDDGTDPHRAYRLQVAAAQQITLPRHVEAGSKNPTRQGGAA